MSNFANILNLAAAVLNELDPSEDTGRTRRPSRSHRCVSYEVNLGELKKAVRKAHFDDERLELVQAAFGFDDVFYPTVDEVYSLLKLFSFDDRRLDATRIIFPHLQDKHNSFKLCDAFLFSVSVRDFQC